MSGQAAGQETQPAAGRAQAEQQYFLALDLIAAGQYEEAIAAFRASVAADSTFLDALHGLIAALRHAGALEEAIAVAQKLIRLDPDDALAYTSLSILYQHSGMIPEAEAAAARAKVLGWKLELAQGRPQTTL